MKRQALRLVAICLAVVMLSVSLVSCGNRLSGVYENNTFGLVITYAFSGNKYTRTMVGLTANDTGYTVSGTYRIKDDTIYLTPENGQGEELPFSQSGKTIYIANMEYVKK